MKPAATLEQANAELAVVNGHYAAANPGMLDAKPKSPQRVRTLKELLIADVRPKLWMLAGAVAFVLLIVCANVGGLSLARASARSREFAVRAAIGAGRARIAGQLLSESAVLAAIGGGAGVALASAVLGVVRRATPLDLPRTGEVRMDATVLIFAIGLSLLSGLLCGLMPAIVASRTDLMSVLRGAGEAGGGGKTGWRFRPRAVLVAAQVGISVVLLIGATLLLKSLTRLYRVDPGFQPDHMLTLSVPLSPTRYDTDAKAMAFYDELIRRVDSLPGVRSAAITLTLPMTGWSGSPVQPAERPPLKLNERPIAIFQAITPDYFRTLEIPLRYGRQFTDHDNKQSPPVAVVNETLARKFWPAYPKGASPIGEHILVGAHFGPREIVGIAADVHQTDREEDPRPEVYFPAAQVAPQPAMLAVRTDGDPISLAPAIRRTVLDIDRDQPVSEVQSMEEVVDASAGPLRLMTRLLGAFSTAAALMAAIGLYGVVSYSVAQRTKEIGIRRAVGAERRHIVSLVLFQAVELSATGIGVGTAVAVAVTSFLKGMLFQVSATDPPTFAAVALLFLLIALAASYIPARRATKVDPLEALRM